MGRSSKLSDAQWNEVAKLRGDGWSAPKIAKRMGQVYGISISPTQINDHLKTHRRERAATARKIVEEHIERTLPGDLQRIEERIEEAKRIERAARERGDPAMALRAMEQIRKLTETKLKFAGAADPVEPALSGLAELVGLAFNKGDDAWKIDAARRALADLAATEKIDAAAARMVLEEPLRKVGRLLSI